jgi:hypothetical protein
MKITLKLWLVVSLVMPLSSVAGADPYAVVRLWTGEPPGPKHPVNGPEQDMTEPTDKPMAGRPIISLLALSRWPAGTNGRFLQWIL